MKLWHLNVSQVEVSRFERFSHLDFSYMYLDVLHLYSSPNFEISYDDNNNNNK